MVILRLLTKLLQIDGLIVADLSMLENELHPGVLHYVEA